jgi:hypothetical protein
MSDLPLELALASTGEQPDCGWVLVPREPTEEMLSAGDSMMPQIAAGEDITTGYDALAEAWPAMIAARPAVPSALASTGEQPASPAAVADYTERATRLGDILASRLMQVVYEFRKTDIAAALSAVAAERDAEIMDLEQTVLALQENTVLDDLRAARQERDAALARLSAAASERDAAAIRAFGQRVWSDTEEVAYQAGSTDEHAALLARLQEPDVREAVRAAVGDYIFQGPGDPAKRAMAALAQSIALSCNSKQQLERAMAALRPFAEIADAYAAVAYREGGSPTQTGIGSA